MGPTSLAFVACFFFQTLHVNRTDETVFFCKQLREYPIDGISFSGVFTGVRHNDVTRKLIAQGVEVVPVLSQRLRITWPTAKVLLH